MHRSFTTIDLIIFSTNDTLSLSYSLVSASVADHQAMRIFLCVSSGGELFHVLWETLGHLPGVGDLGSPTWGLGHLPGVGDLGSPTWGLGHLPGVGDLGSPTWGLGHLPGVGDLGSPTWGLLCIHRCQMTHRSLRIFFPWLLPSESTEVGTCPALPSD